MRAPLNFVRAAFLPALVGIAVSAVALVLLDRPRLRLLAVASGLTALVCGGHGRPHPVHLDTVGRRLRGLDHHARDRRTHGPAVDHRLRLGHRPP